MGVYMNWSILYEVLQVTLFLVSFYSQRGWALQLRWTILQGCKIFSPLIKHQGRWVSYCSLSQQKKNEINAPPRGCLFLWHWSNLLSTISCDHWLQPSSNRQGFCLYPYFLQISRPFRKRWVPSQTQLTLCTKGTSDSNAEIFLLLDRWHPWRYSASLYSLH